ncbi:hypothetical protein DI53_3655 [Sphingobacterium deserti]|uniref:Uncharacterized protein n=1 Tax=Sphingobacterium deserti TaxID=1229276 RepID=A0A0B8T694_9SPHI|nr:hypothetical protein DI53_3655 [Sphingobacterium deserti]
MIHAEEYVPISAFVGFFLFGVAATDCFSERQIIQKLR